MRVPSPQLKAVSDHIEPLVSESWPGLSQPSNVSLAEGLFATPPSTVCRLRAAR
jgi:hypothetical protein